MSRRCEEARGPPDPARNLSSTPPTPTRPPGASLRSNVRHLSLPPPINLNADVGLSIFKFVVDGSLTRLGVIHSVCSALRLLSF
jgi:hypothetical protein